MQARRLSPAATHIYARNGVRDSPQPSSITPLIKPRPSIRHTHSTNAMCCAVLSVSCVSCVSCVRQTIQLSAGGIQIFAGKSILQHVQVVDAPRCLHALRRWRPLLQHMCTNAMELFDFLNIEAKKDFMHLHRRLLAKRLLSIPVEDYYRVPSDFNNELEHYIVSRLQRSEGDAFTRKAQYMLRDLQGVFVGRDRRDEKDASTDAARRQKLPVLTAAVVSLQQWPSEGVLWDLGAHSVTRSLQSTMLRCRDAFELHHGRTATPHRDLHTSWRQSTATLQALFPRLNCRFTTIQIKMTGMQAMLLSCFAKQSMSSGHSVKEIATCMNIRWDEQRDRPEKAHEWKMLTNLLISVLRPFPDTRGSLIIKSPKRGPPILPSDKFCINLKFQSRNRKLHIRTPKCDHVDVDRRKKPPSCMAIIAAIVRLMKARSICSHKELVYEVIRRIPRFKINAQDIKKCIAILLQREFIERMSDDKSKYVYRA